MLWIVIVGFVAGVLARLISPGPNKPGGFILTTIVLGIAGAFLATWIGQTIGWYHADQGAGFIGATIGALGAVHLEPIGGQRHDRRSGRRPSGLMSTTLVIFDLDGTLADSFPGSCAM